MQIRQFIPTTLSVVALGWAGTPMTQAATANSEASAASGELSAASAGESAIRKIEIEPEVLSLIATKWGSEFNHVTYPAQALDNIVTVHPGDSIQSAIDSAAAAGGGVVWLKSGTHMLAGPIILKSKVTLCGEGQDRTILKQAESFASGVALSAKGQLTDFVIKDLTLDGLQTVQVSGIELAGPSARSDWHARIMLQNIKVTNWGRMGVHIKRATDIVMDNSEFQHNGSANSLFHNIYFLFVERVLQSDCDMSFPVLGKGNKYTSTKDLIAQRCTIQECRGNGIQADHADCARLFFHKYSISKCGWVAMWFPCEDFFDKFTFKEDPKYAPQFVILNRCSIIDNRWGAMWRSVRNAHVINSTFRNQEIDMGLLKCEVAFENSTLVHSPQHYTDVSQWPKDVKILW